MNMVMNFAIRKSGESLYGADSHFLSLWKKSEAIRMKIMAKT